MHNLLPRDYRTYNIYQFQSDNEWFLIGNQTDRTPIHALTGHLHIPQYRIVMCHQQIAMYKVVDAFNGHTVFFKWI